MYIRINGSGIDAHGAHLEDERRLAAALSDTLQSLSLQAREAPASVQARIREAREAVRREEEHIRWRMRFLDELTAEFARQSEETEHILEGMSRI